MNAVDELAATLASVGSALDRLGVAWAIGGSLASAAYGEPRATNDVDIVAVLSEDDARRLPTLLGDDFYADAVSAVDAVRRNDSFNVIDQRSFLKVDIFVPARGALGDGQLARRRRLALVGGVDVWALGPEDVVLQKLRWYRLGGGVSDRQWRDVVEVLRATELDDEYLSTTAAVAGLGDLLARARRDAR